MYRQFLVHRLPLNRNLHKSILVSLPWLTLKDTQEEQVCFFIRPSDPAQEFTITSLLKLLPTEVILKFLSWNSKSPFAWSYLASSVWSLIICLQESCFNQSNVFILHTTLCAFQQLLHSLPLFKLPSPSWGYATQIQPLCYSLTQVFSSPNTDFSPCWSILTLTGYGK